MAITPLPPAPQVTDDTATFNTKAFAWVDAIDTFTTEANSTATQVNTDASTASSAASTATTQAGIATTKASEASADADAAAASAVEAAGLVENYQGALASDPSLNKDGDALVAGDWYVNTATGLIRAYTGSVWVTSVNVTAGVESINGQTGVVTLEIPEAAEVLTPINVSPADEATVDNESFTLEGSTYYSLYGKTQKSSQWQIDTTSDFSSSPLAYDSSEVSGVGVTHIVPEGNIVVSTTYYWRTRYRDIDDTWSEWSTPTEFTTASAFSFEADFLVIAGGGGGANGGGGAGGYRELTAQKLFPSTNYLVTVGAGGAAGTAEVNGSNGSNSVFNTITSAGGGFGNGYAVSGSTAGSGGSGGGGHGRTGGSSGLGGAGNTPSTSPSQGNNGGNGITGGTGGAAGGGGGASAAALNATVDGVATAGGAGTASSITGSSVIRAGGGGGASTSGTGGAGGAGGGGAGGSGASGVAGTLNTGGGGGGGAFSGSPLNGGAGGSGVVIVKYPDSLTISNSGGGLTFSTATAGGFKVTTFTAGTGNIQFA